MHCQNFTYVSNFVKVWFSKYNFKIAQRIQFVKGATQWNFWHKRHSIALVQTHLVNLVYSQSSVTRLCKFWNFLATNFIAKAAQMFGDFSGSCETIAF